MIRPTLTALTALALCAAAPLTAQTAEPPGDAHAALATALTSDDYIEQSYQRVVVAGFDGALRSAPDMVATEGACPGLFAAMADAVEPIMRHAYRRDFLAYRDRLAALLRTEMRADQAREAATFFGSGLGRRFLGALAANVSVEAVTSFAQASDGPAIPADALEADTMQSARDGLGALEPLDRREVEQTLTTAAWAGTFVRLQPTIAQYQLEMANADYLPEEDAALDAALDAAAQTHLAACHGDD